MLSVGASGGEQLATLLTATGIYKIINHFIKQRPKSFLYICLRCKGSSWWLGAVNNVDEVEMSNLKEVINANISPDDRIIFELE